MYHCGFLCVFLCGWFLLEYYCVNNDVVHGAQTTSTSGGTAAASVSGIVDQNFRVEYQRMDTVSCSKMHCIYITCIPPRTFFQLQRSCASLSSHAMHHHKCFFTTRPSTKQPHNEQTILHISDHHLPSYSHILKHAVRAFNVHPRHTPTHPTHAPTHTNTACYCLFAIPRFWLAHSVSLQRCCLVLLRKRCSRVLSTHLIG